MQFLLALCGLAGCTDPSAARAAGDAPRAEELAAVAHESQPTLLPPIDLGRPWPDEGDEPWRVCAERQCRGGIFRVDAYLEDQDLEGVEGRFFGLVPSSEHHPNGRQPPGQTHRVLRVPTEPLEPGRFYAMILAGYSTLGDQAVFVDDSGPSGLARLTEILRSPSAYENDATWQRRRRLWHAFTRQHERDGSPLEDHWPFPHMLVQRMFECWGESPDGRWLAVAGRGMVGIYDFVGDRIELHRPATGRWEPNRITFENDGFAVWKDEHLIEILEPPGYQPGAPETVGRELDDRRMRQLRALFAARRSALRQAGADADVSVGAYDVSPDARYLVTTVDTYDSTHGTLRPYLQPRPWGDYNRISFEGRYALYWANGSAWVRMGLQSGEVEHSG